MTKKKSSLLRSLANVSGMTLISWGFGFARDTLRAVYLGAGAATEV